LFDLCEGEPADVHRRGRVVVGQSLSDSGMHNKFFCIINALC